MVIRAGDKSYLVVLEGGVEKTPLFMDNGDQQTMVSYSDLSIK